MNNELIAYYVNLLILQYRSKEKASSTVEAIITAIMIYDLMIAVRDGYNIDTAVGTQLDILGKYLGSDRIVTGSFTRDYFGFIEYGDIAPFTNFPFSLYGEEPGDVQWKTYKEASESLFALTDTEYRQILKFKIVQNYSNASNKEIDLFLDDFFGDQVIFTDLENMFISYIFQDTVERLVTIAISEGLLPKPAGVGLIVTFTHDIENIYTYGTYGDDPPDFAVGFSTYGNTPVGGWLRYG